MAFRQIDEPLRDDEKSRFVRLDGITPQRAPKDELKGLDFDTMLFVGSGAIDGGWQPIRQLCTEIIDGRFLGLVDYGTNNCYF